MDKSRALELLSANDILLEEISKIINYKHLDDPIYNLLGREWTRNGSIIYFDRDVKNYTMYDYTGYQISSLGTKGVELYCGESDGIFYALAHPEDENWDETSILILNMDNFKEFDEEQLD